MDAAQQFSWFAARFKQGPQPRAGASDEDHEKENALPPAPPPRQQPSQLPAAPDGRPQGSLRPAAAMAPPQPRKPREAPALVADPLGSQAIGGGRAPRQNALHSALALMRGKQSGSRRPKSQLPRPAGTERPVRREMVGAAPGNEARLAPPPASTVSKQPPSQDQQLQLRSEHPLEEEPQEGEAGEPAASASRSCGSPSGRAAVEQAAAPVKPPWQAGILYGDYFAAARRHLRRVASSSLGLR